MSDRRQILTLKHMHGVRKHNYFFTNGNGVPTENSPWRQNIHCCAQNYDEEKHCELV